MEGLGRGVGRLISISWRVFGIAFAILAAAFIVVLSQGEQAPDTRVGRVAAVVMFITMPLAGVTGLAIFFSNLRRIVLRLKSGQRFSDFDPRNRD